MQIKGWYNFYEIPVLCHGGSETEQLIFSQACKEIAGFFFLTFSGSVDAPGARLYLNTEKVR